MSSRVVAKSACCLPGFAKWVGGYVIRLNRTPESSRGTDIKFMVLCKQLSYWLRARLRMYVCHSRRRLFIAEA